MKLRQRPGRPRSNSMGSCSINANDKSNLITSIPAIDRTNMPSSLLEKADAVARMTLELNMRAVSIQAERLEQEVKSLVLSTSEDRLFRQVYERRMEDMYKEITAVKHRMEEVEQISPVELEQTRQNAERAVQDLRDEMMTMKDSMQDLSQMLKGLPTFLPPPPPQQLSPPPSQPTRSQSDVPDRRPTYQIQTRSKTFPLRSQSPQSRIKETVNSTRRWNREHRTTELADNTFVANYLRKQFKRDPQLAIFIQKSIKHRIQPRLAKRTAKPDSLDDFCKDVLWEDVKIAIEETLVINPEEVMKILK